MPNHVTNLFRIKGTPEQVTTVRDTLRGEWEEERDKDRERPIDFAKLLPMPESLNVTHGSEVRVAEWEMQHKDERGRLPLKPPAHVIEHAEKNRELVDQIKENIRVHGLASWYEWNIKKWGTKWNAYSQEEIEPNLIRFETAWSAPRPFYEAVAARFPEVEFVIEYADEDTGSNCGTLTYRNGTLASFEEPPGNYTNKERRMFAYRVQGVSKEDIELYEREREEEG